MKLAAAIVALILIASVLPTLASGARAANAGEVAHTAAVDAAYNAR